MEKIRISVPLRGFGSSLGNMIQVLSGEASSKLEGNWIDVEERTPGVFTVVDENLTTKDGDWIVDDTSLGFSSWDEEVADLDAGNSDESQCFGMSDRLVWKDVELTPYEFRAPSVERLIESFNHVEICAWCPGDI